MGFSGPSTPGATEVLIGLMLLWFSTLLVWGLLSAFDALFPPLGISAAHRVALRWIGLNRVEPTVTVLLTVTLFFVRLGEVNPAMIWLVPSLMSFFGMLLPPVFFSSTDADSSNVYRRLRQIFVVRLAPFFFITLGSMLDQEWIVVGALLAGLIGLGWSWLVLMREAVKLRAASQPTSTKELVSDEIA